MKSAALDGIASEYAALNAKNTAARDQTQVFGLAQQRWKQAENVWNNTFGYVPVVGNAGNIVFGIHDANTGMTAEERRGGSAAAAIASLQLAHEAAQAGAGAESELPHSGLNASFKGGWKVDPQTNEFRFTPPPKEAESSKAPIEITDGHAEGDPNVVKVPGWNKAIYDDTVSLTGRQPDEQGIYRIDDHQYIDLEGRPVHINGLRNNGQPNFVDEHGQAVSSNVPHVRYEGGGKWAINRLPGGIQVLQGVDDYRGWEINYQGKRERVIFDLEKNRWQLRRNGEYVEWSADHQQFVRIKNPPIATDTDRAESLRQFGFDSPPNIVSTVPGNTDIPMGIHQIWLGEPSKLLEKAEMLEKNAKIAKKGGYKLIIHVGLKDGYSPTTLEEMTKKIPSAELVNLHEEPFFKEYQKRPSYEVFDFFANSKDRNYAAAADALRYPLLNSRGGLYMDIDDTLLGKFSDGSLPFGLGKRKFKTNRNDLVLAHPLSHFSMGSKTFFGNSFFGSLKDNPLLVKMEEETRIRFNENRRAFENRPYGQAQNMTEYQRKIFITTGPIMFTDILTAEQPKYAGVLVLNNIERKQIKLTPQMAAWKRAHTPLSDLSEIGHDHSWRNTR